MVGRKTPRWFFRDHPEYINPNGRSFHTAQDFIDSTPLLAELFLQWYPDVSLAGIAKYYFGRENLLGGIMNTEEQQIEPFLLPSDEMFNKIIMAPEKYPILVFQPRLSLKNLKRHIQMFHVYPAKEKTNV